VFVDAALRNSRCDFAGIADSVRQRCAELERRNGIIVAPALNRSAVPIVNCDEGSWRWRCRQGAERWSFSAAGPKSIANDRRPEWWHNQHPVRRCWASTRKICSKRRAASSRRDQAVAPGRRGL